MPVREGYKFLYWQDGMSEFDFSKPITKDVNLMAKWLKLKPITVVLNGVNTPIYIEPKNSYELKDFDINIEGATLIGFYQKINNNFIEVDLSKGIDENSTIYADFMTEGLIIEQIVEKNEMQVVNYTGSATNIIVPSFYYNMPVTKITNINKANIDSIYFGNNIEILGEGSFSECVIKDITLPSSITTIEDSAFANSTINNINFAKESKLKTIGTGAFNNVKTLQKIILPYGLNKICELAFYYCEDLEVVYIPNTCTTLEKNIFAFCSNSIKVYRQHKRSDFTYNDLNWQNNPNGRLNVIYVSSVNDL